MKKLLLALFALTLMLSACRRNNNIQPTPQGYYFKFTLGGTEYLFDNDLFQIGSTENYEFGGYVPGSDLSKNGGFKLWYSDSARASDILQLPGDTFYFDRSGNPFADIRWNTGGFATYNYGDETSDHNYFVAISSVRFLRNDTVSSFWNLDVYEVKGTFRAKMMNGNTDDPMGDATNGEFNMQCSAFHFN